ncbi:MAG: hypothetical protein HN392_12740 [Anaerolineae bacterium]|jgi:WD40 repeat protein|nr:hypothetical protein [Anaerolineae bacterium]MBT7074527.1 hypothetical protein [Anaerolineae bacterium]MBT7781439.1 hypothetical protein [Anaerolineae bacterium]
MNTFFPNRDIVFQLGVSYTGSTDEIGFINADGSDLHYFQIPFKESVSIQTPVWTDDGGLLFFGAPNTVVTALIEKDYPLTLKLRNKWTYQPSLIHGTHEILLNSVLDEFTSAILREDYFSAEILETYPMDQSISRIYLGANNFVKQQLLYSQLIKEDNNIYRYELVILDTNTNQISILLSYSGIPQEVTRILNPAFSPSGEWIAYTSNDGIYLIRPDGSEIQRIVQMKNMRQFWTSAASWSPDGKSIVYHYCTKDGWDCEGDTERENNIIYRYDLETKEERVLVVGGVNPYWRWDTTE